MDTERNVMKPDSTGLAPGAALSFSPKLAGEWPHLQPEVRLTLENVGNAVNRVQRQEL